MEHQEFNRTIPLVLLLAVIGVLALHHWYVVTEGSAILSGLGIGFYLFKYVYGF